MKRFELIMTADDDGCSVECDNDGFNALEIIGALEAKKQDIIDQIRNPDKYKFVRHCIDEDGQKFSKVEDTDNGEV